MQDTNKKAATGERTELVFILDRSGSMGGLEGDTIGGFNAMLQKQKELDAPCRVTTALFDNEFELLHDRIDLMAVAPITQKEYFVRGSTALLDAVGRTIHKIKQVQDQTAPEFRAGKVLFVIITDGMENASREFTYAAIKEMINERRAIDGWEFVFLGANIDAVKEAAQIGIHANRAQNYHADAQGTNAVYQAMSESMRSFRSAPAMAPLDTAWQDEIRKDYEGRKKKPR